MDQIPPAIIPDTPDQPTQVLDPRNSLKPGRILGLLALGGLALGCFFVMKPFISALLWAAILAFCTWPVFRWLCERFKIGRGWAALIMVVVQMVVLGVPLVLATPTRGEDIDGLRSTVENLITNGLPGIGAWLGGLPLVGSFIAERLAAFETDFSGVASLIQPYAGVIAQQLLSVLLAVLSGLAEFGLAIVLSCFFYRDGARIAETTSSVMARIAGPRGHTLLILVANVTRGVVYGLLGTAVAQGLMTGLGLWIAGVPQAVLLGVVAGIISILPVGAPLVWIPAAIWLFTQGQTGWGIFMLIYGAAGISSVDNVIRPWLIARGADLPLLLTILGALGGVLAFGFLGLFLGPVLLAVGFTLLKEWADSTRPEGSGA